MTLLLPFIVCVPLMLLGSFIMAVGVQSPALMYLFGRVVKREVLSKDPGRHEAYLQLKEVEYGHLFGFVTVSHLVRNVDFVWASGNFFLFSSYRRAWAAYKVCLFVLRSFLLMMIACSCRLEDGCCHRLCVFVRVSSCSK